MQGDKQRYYQTTFTDKHGRSQRAIACQQSVMGMTAAAALATKATILFRPRYLLMCDIAAGIQTGSEQLFGDVLVPDEVWDCTTGKIVGPNESEIRYGAIGFLPRPNPCVPTQISRQ
ncbi:MAG: hypothetical protein IKF14_16295 [Atopobiaceae bacterium]|nr:hypothetical protein [Atopobiaceae bacterium]